MGVVMDKEKENYKVLDLILEHIHILHSPETSHLMVSQRKISELQGFETNNESRPIGVFVGFNHFRETVIFGAVLMYDEMFESFKWLFETFLKAHNGKQPKAIYIDQDSAMGRAVKEVFIDSDNLGCKLRVGRYILFTPQYISCQNTIEIQDINRNILQTYNISKMILQSTSYLTYVI
jgi:hypothetical protein